MRQNENSDDELPQQEEKIRAEEVCTYIAAILDELFKMADKHHISFLAYLIEMARLEALDQQKLIQSPLEYKKLD